MEELKFDLKDRKILRELDIDFRQSFSSIGKKVGLSKNSVALRFEKLKSLMLHNVTGINNEVLGYTMVKVFYSFDFYNEATEKMIILQLKKQKHILWAARFYGAYDLCICLLVKNMGDLIDYVNEFNNYFSKRINQKEIQIVHKQFYFRNNFLHDEPVKKVYEVLKTEKRFSLTDTDKKILNEIRYDPRLSVMEISRKTKLNPKTITSRINFLEKNKIIMGYFMTIDPTKFDFSTFKLLLQVQNIKDDQEFESYISSIKNVRYITKMLGLWDYEIDCVYSNITELQKQIDEIKEKFPNSLKKVAILNFGKRIITNKQGYLV